MKLGCGALALSLVVGSTACGDADGRRNRTPPGIPTAKPVAVREAPEAPADPEEEPEAARAPSADDAFFNDGFAFPAAPSSVEEAVAARQAARAASADVDGEDEAQQNEEPERALDEELMALLRPAVCLDMAAGDFEEGAQLEIHGEAMVLPSGRLQSTAVRVAGQPESALRCLADQLEAGRVEAPVDGAPLRVSGVLRMQVHGVPARTR